MSATDFLSNCKGVITKFVARLRSGVSTNRETPMPWTNFSNLTENDLRSVFQYLRSVSPLARESGPSVRNVGVYTMPKT